MNVRIPIPRPVEDVSDPTPERGGVDAEELRRIQQRAERYVAEQATGANAAIAQREAEQHAALVRQQEITTARAIVARSETIRSEGTRRLVMSIAGGAIAGLVLGNLLFGGHTR